MVCPSYVSVEANQEPPVLQPALRPQQDVEEPQNPKALR